MNNKNEYFVSKLLHKQSNAQNDIRIFNRYVNGEISIETCIDWFKSNNKINKDYEICKNDFIDWLSSIGWRKY